MQAEQRQGGLSAAGQLQRMSSLVSARERPDSEQVRMRARAQSGGNKSFALSASLHHCVGRFSIWSKYH
jgi:hypothetical protein